MTYVPLNVHSQYSILDSTASVSALVDKAKQFGLSTLAITDHGNLYGAIDFYKACHAANIKPILGCTLLVAPSARGDKKKLVGMPHGFPIILLAKNRLGYRNLCKLSSVAFLEGFYYTPRIDKELLMQYAEGLICLSGSVEGPLGHCILQGKEKELIEEISWYHSLFGADFYLELQRHPLDESAMGSEGWLVQKAKDYVRDLAKVEKTYLALAQQYNIPCVATNDIHYLEKEDWKAHEILLNIYAGEPCEIWERDSHGNLKNKVPNPKREASPTHEKYFKSTEQMRLLFSSCPEALEETVRIAEKCNCELDFKTKHYPVFTPPALEGQQLSPENRLKEAEQFLKTLSLDGIATRYTPEKLARVAKVYPGRDPLEVVRSRFEYEFEILTSKGMCDYMLIVYDFIAWAKQRKIPVGPGRGSAAGSIISYLIGITDIEPLCFHLFFQRFINPERISYPDIDVDICMERRQEVIDYVVAKYGKDKVAQIITFGTMKAKMAIRDVGRVLNVPLSKVNQIASLVPEDPGMTLEKAFQIDPELTRLMETDEEARHILEMAKKIEGSIRNTSTHAAGLIISADAITEHIPVCTAKDSAMVVTQYAMKPVESVGMLKIDFLGLKTLTSIQHCVDEIAEKTHTHIDWINLPLDDAQTFNLLNQGKTLGVFQLESGGMQDLSKQLHIDTFEEIIAVGALYRPGPMDMIPSFINRKHGREAIEMDHPLLQELLGETYGVMVYQEQVMQIASVLAGYTLGEGDVLRRAMGKKDKQEMARQKEKFVTGCQAKNIDADTALRIFEKIEKFASYGFNKSHAAAYAYLSYVTAFLKAHYPAEWLAALMTCDRDDITKIAKFIAEARALHIATLPPDINESHRSFRATSKGIRFAMTAIKGVGENVVEHILEERKKNGPYRNLYHFMQRIDKTRVGKKQIELLCEAGAFDFTGWSRDSLQGSVEPMFEKALREQKEHSLGILDLFAAEKEQADISSGEQEPLTLQKTSRIHKLQREKELLGFYITGHPMDAYKELLTRLSCVPLKDFETFPDNALVRAAFVIESVQIKVSQKSQRKFAILIIGDGCQRFECPIWPELYEEKHSFIQENRLLYGIIQLERKEQALQLQCRALEDITTFDEEKMRACDSLYDTLKAQSKAYEPKWKNKAASTKKTQDAPVVKSLLLQADANQLRLSQIITLKNLFREHSGASSIELRFVSRNTHLATLAIPSQWGVKISADLLKEIEQMGISVK